MKIGWIELKIDYKKIKTKINSTLIIIKDYLLK